MKKCCCFPLETGVHIIGWIATCFAILNIIGILICAFMTTWACILFLLLLLPMNIAVVYFLKMRKDNNRENRREFADFLPASLGVNNMCLLIAALWSGSHFTVYVKVLDAYGPNFMWLSIIGTALAVICIMALSVYFAIVANAYAKELEPK